MLKFEPISLDRQDQYLELLGSGRIDASDYSFINLWAWLEVYGLQWAWTEDIVWIRQTKPEEIFWAPVCIPEKITWREAFKSLGEETLSFIRVPSAHAGLWEQQMPGQADVREERGQWDYLYSFKELVELSGNRFHKKKNLLNQFRKKYTYEYVELHGPLIEQTRETQERWCQWRDCESSETLSAENRAIDRVLGSWASLRNILGGALIVEGKEAAFSIAEKSSQNTLIIHFEKGFTQYAGVYQAVNQMFLASQSDKGFTTVNREQDLDEENLRQAKLSYNPVGFIRKYSVTLDLSK
ncbi:MAG TPA: phosphatidylglycerol lysyltransferase domain-containing protein [Deltaproteobacteria bacterium]|jgi:hypothetical protein|nr:phosphatidylglycerol lysyltransferase domain-containing protein [Deltaproteobacteria bacterium]HQI00132.1 phosphatidylglycerol lysyltransferase domain-containing protein [Deltaproteobacteria bacterium]